MPPDADATSTGRPDSGRRLGADAVDVLLADVEAADAVAAAAWPGRPTRRQPVQVLYVPADQVTSDTTRAAGDRAAGLLRRHAPDGTLLAAATGIAEGVADAVHERVVHKLATEPVEDLRVDFEDGYGRRADAVEDEHAVATGRALADLLDGDGAPAFCGLRVKSFTDGLARRSVATLDLFLAALLDRAGDLPAGFVVTFPKIVSPDHVATFVEVLAALEDAHDLAPGSLRFEAQVETTASVLDGHGRVALRAIRDAGAGRLVAAHVGIFDYTAALGLPAEEQRLDHPACDFARHLLQVTFADTDVLLSDGSTNVRPADDGEAEVLATWRRHAAHVRHSLAHGYVQGWDLDASHLVSRYATVYGHLLDGLDEVLARLAAWEAGTSGSTMDEPATIAVLSRRVDRARACGALPSDGSTDPGPTAPTDAPNRAAPT